MRWKWTERRWNCNSWAILRFERKMAKHGTMRGGARIGSGRKSKILTEKIDSGLAATVIDLSKPAEVKWRLVEIVFLCQQLFLFRHTIDSKGSADFRIYKSQYKSQRVKLRCKKHPSDWFCEATIKEHPRIIGRFVFWRQDEVYGRSLSLRESKRDVSRCCFDWRNRLQVLIVKSIENQGIIHSTNAKTNARQT